MHLPLTSYRAFFGCPCGLWQHARIGLLMLADTPDKVIADIQRSAERRV